VKSDAKFFLFLVVSRKHKHKHRKLRDSKGKRIIKPANIDAHAIINTPPRVLVLDRRIFSHITGRAGVYCHRWLLANEIAAHCPAQQSAHDDRRTSPSFSAQIITAKFTTPHRIIVVSSSKITNRSTSAATENAFTPDCPSWLSNFNADQAYLS
jgi:hypothetical protein